MKLAMGRGERLLGSMFVTARTGRWDHTIREAGFDFLVIDNEHAPYSRTETADWMAKLTEMGICPFIRVPNRSPHHVLMALDGGAQGVIVPYVETPEQVRETVWAAKFRPLQGRMLEEAAAGRFPSEETRLYLEELNRNNLLFISVESVAAVERVEELLAVKGVDGVLIGSYDLSIQLGLPNQYQSEAFVKTARRVIAACRQHRVPVMIHGFNLDMARMWIEEGVNLVLFGTDRRTFSEGFVTDFAFLRDVGEGKPAERPRLRLVRTEGKTPER